MSVIVTRMRPVNTICQVEGCGNTGVSVVIVCSDDHYVCKLENRCQEHQS
jgi:hypothetical protein